MSLDIEAVEKVLWPYGSTRDIWMIVDAARERGIYAEIINSYFEYSCLYSGEIPFELEVAAPYLVQLEYQDKYTRRLLQKSWGKSWGVFLKCDARMERLRRHLRTFLLVNDWRGRRLVFRYYDPRVLRVYLPTCRADELKTVYGPIQTFWTEDETGGNLLEFRYQSGNMQQKSLAAAAR